MAKHIPRNVRFYRRAGKFWAIETLKAQIGFAVCKLVLKFNGNRSHLKKNATVLHEIPGYISSASLVGYSWLRDISAYSMSYMTI